MYICRGIRRNLYETLFQGIILRPTLGKQGVLYYCFSCCMFKSIFLIYILFQITFTRPEEFTKPLGRRTPADRIQGTVTLTVTVIEPSERPQPGQTMKLRLLHVLLKFSFLMFLHSLSLSYRLVLYISFFKEFNEHARK